MSHSNATLFLVTANQFEHQLLNFQICFYGTDGILSRQYCARGFRRPEAAAAPESRQHIRCGRKGKFAFAVWCAEKGAHINAGPEGPQQGHQHRSIFSGLFSAIICRAEWYLLVSVCGIYLNLFDLLLL